MKDTIDVLELLESQHAEVDQLIEQLERGRGDRGALFAELADKLAAHSAVEEKIFYPAAMKRTGASSPSGGSSHAPTDKAPPAHPEQGDVRGMFWSRAQALDVSA